MRLEREPTCDEKVVRKIITHASERHIKTEGAFGHFVRPYLEAGYPREVAEAHRRLFRH
jgi:hypothetical protein